MPADQSVTFWLRRAQDGDPAAAQQLWERYFGRLVGLARKKLQGLQLRVADEEDVALNAFGSFYRGLQGGRYPQLHDRDNLWGLLLVITARKAADLVRDEHRLKRGGGAVQGESGFLDAAPLAEDQAGIDGVIGAEPTPAFAAEVAEECQRPLDALEDAELQRVAWWKMEGYTTDEIAAKLGCVPRTVERKLRAIRSIWESKRGKP